MYVAYALLQNALTVFKYTVRLMVPAEEGKQWRCLLALHIDLVSPPSHTTRWSCVRLVWDLWAGYVCYYTCL